LAHPFFGNPRNAIVATIGVNPSSGEFKPSRDWSSVRTQGAWKMRLKNYLTAETPHKWFPALSTRNEKPRPFSNGSTLAVTSSTGYPTVANPQF